MTIHYKNILNYFDNRGANASIETLDTIIEVFKA